MSRPRPSIRLLMAVVAASAVVSAAGTWARRRGRYLEMAAHHRRMAARELWGHVHEIRPDARPSRADLDASFDHARLAVAYQDAAWSLWQVAPADPGVEPDPPATLRDLRNRPERGPTPTSPPIRTRESTRAARADPGRG